jgi:hypothetical protein
MNHVMVVALAAQYGVDVDVILTYVDSMVEIKATATRDEALDTIIPVMCLGTDDAAIEATLANRQGRGKHRA